MNASAEVFSSGQASERWTSRIKLGIEADDAHGRKVAFSAIFLQNLERKLPDERDGCD